MAQIVKLRRSSVSGQKPTNSNLQLGELALNTTDGKVFLAKSGSLGPSVEELISTNATNTGSINLIGSITASGQISSSFIGDGAGLYNIPASGVTGLNLNKIISGSASASISPNKGLEVNTRVTATEFTGSGLGLTNVPFYISGSDVLGNTVGKTFTKLQFDDSTGLNVEETDPGTAFISIGSHFKDIFVSGSPLLSATGSDAFEIKPEGGIEITTVLTDSNYNGYSKELIISTTNLSSSLNGRIDQITGSVSSINNFTSSVVLTSQTGSMSVLSASYALTAAYVLNGGGGGGTASGVSDGAYAELNQTTPSTTWTFTHNLGQKYPIFQVFDTSDRVIIPTQISAVSSNVATITFSSAQAGRVIASLGTGPGGMTQYFEASTTWSLAHNMGADYPIVTVYNSNRNIILPQEIKSIDGDNIEVYFSAPVAGFLNVAKGGHIISGSVGITNLDLGGSNIVSSSIQIEDYGYAITGSNTFEGNQTINGSLTLGESLFKNDNSVTISSNANIATVSMSTYNAAFFDYVVKNGTNMRAGTVMGVWNGSNVQYNEVSTNDLGNTSGISFSVNLSSGNASLFATITAGTWSINVLTRGL